MTASKLRKLAEILQADKVNKIALTIVEEHSRF